MEHGPLRTQREATERDDFHIAAPKIASPKGGGALHGLGEKFEVNPSNGTSSLRLPIRVSPGRGAISPELSLSYDSGSGNGPFGLGWHMALPAITRKTDKGLPRYIDSAESDIFLLSGAEDLVPQLDSAGGWTQTDSPRTVYGKKYLVRRYRPRIEGLFVRIERWSGLADPTDIFWRTIGRDNVTSWYGRDGASRIYDPADPRRIFSWLLCERHDDTGNVASYRYKAEDGAGVDTQAAHERNRTAAGRTANRYLKRILYANRTPYFPDLGAAAAVPLPTDFCFELVFDFGDHDKDAPLPDEPGKAWSVRPDPFSVHHATFEVRTYRLCRRILMFHHFPAVADVGANCLTGSTDIVYQHDLTPADPGNPIYAFVASIGASGYRRSGTSYLARQWPALRFSYARAQISSEIEDVDPRSLDNLPEGLDGSRYQWVDLDGEGLSGILSEHPGGWRYKRNLSPLGEPPEPGNPSPAARFAPSVAVDPLPRAGEAHQFLDLAGDGTTDLVMFDSATPGFYERTHENGWRPFRAFKTMPVLNWRDPNLKFVDLTGDGHADILISEDDLFYWHEALAEDGFAPASRIIKALDEEDGPRLVFADGTDTIFLADMSGDGLSDIARIRNGEICYWPNLGYGRFGPKVAMESAPVFARVDEFDGRKVRLTDVDGTGTTDVLYFSPQGTSVYFNQSGNGWSAGRTIPQFPPVDTASSAVALDLLGTGTSCLVWSSGEPGARRMRYVDLTGGVKPHLMTGYSNGLGAETVIHYAPSTRFYLEDEMAGRPWITRIPFPVQVVERIETFDWIARSLFVTRHAYHHGYFDGVEREFRGFGMVEQWDTAEFATLAGGSSFPTGDNIDAASHVPPVLTRTWYHTGIYLGRDRVSNYFAGLLTGSDKGEYYREPGLTDAQAKALLLADTIMPLGLTVEEEREAARALKGSMLRQEVYALDGTAKEPHPYSVTEQNFTIAMLQPQAGNLYGVFFAHPREVLTYQYERDPSDPRVTHALTLETDPFGNARRVLKVGYGRRVPDPSLSADDRKRQGGALLTYAENAFTVAIDAADAYRTPLVADARSYEVTGYLPSGRFGFDEWTANNFQKITLAVEIPYEQAADNIHPQKRLIERAVTRYRKDDLTGFAAAGFMESLGIVGQRYKLAFTPGLLGTYTRTLGGPPENLLPAPAAVLGSTAGDGGGYVDLLGDGHWWIPSGRSFFDSTADPANPAATAAAELAQAHAHFFRTRLYADPFGGKTIITFDAADLLLAKVVDAAGNITAADQDYRVLSPVRITEPNGNRVELAYNALGLLAATAVRGKAAETLGDALAGFEADPPQSQIDAFFAAAEPRGPGAALLKDATAAYFCDITRFARSRAAAPDDPSSWLPSWNATLARETHLSDLAAGHESRIAIDFAYSDGFGRAIQTKMRAEDGSLGEGGPTVSPRWIGSGWTIFDNKGSPVRQYEPFFTAAHDFEFAVAVGVSPVLLYDPTKRKVAQLNPDHSWSKSVFGAWRNEEWDASDTAAVANPAADTDVGDFFARLPSADYLPGWCDARLGGAWGARERTAAQKTLVHAATPAVVHSDVLGRAFLEIRHNRYQLGLDPAVEEFHQTHTLLDIEGNHRAITDARNIVTMRSDFDVVGRHLHSASPDGGEHWTLPDVMDHPVRAWDSRGQNFRTLYDALRREAERHVASGAPEVLAVRTIHGESQPTPEASNLRGKVYRVCDQGGTRTTGLYDFKGNGVRDERQFATDYKSLLDWSGAVALDAAVHVQQSHFDALNRPDRFVEADGSIVAQSYNDAGVLNAVAVQLRGAAAATAFVANIDYDAKGRRTRIEYGGATDTLTEYFYDPLTFRLRRLTTTRRGYAGDDRVVQDISYVYDPLGNVMSIRDDAQQTVFFRNKRVEPGTDYTYDALSRLIEGAGREHLGLTGGVANAPTPPDAGNHFATGLDHLGDGNALGLYVERYAYDGTGNILNMRHRGSNPATPGWRRCFQYASGSNRLLSTTNPALAHDPDKDCTNDYGTVPVYVEKYAYDGHGNIVQMPHLSAMVWDYRDALRSTARGTGTGAETTWYVYDANGERIRKITELSGGAVKDDRLYVGRAELYVKNGAGALTRETLHVMDGKARVAMVETRTDLPVPEQLVRYQLGNHLGSAVLELDDAAAIISYEEYFPFGSTSYQAVRNHTEASKRYRFTAKERDEESGFYYFGARYYPPWLARWLSPDPVGPKAGESVYDYAANNPATFHDPDGREPKRGQLGSAADVSKEASTVQLTVSQIRADMLKEKVTALGGKNIPDLTDLTTYLSVLTAAATREKTILAEHGNATIPQSIAVQNAYRQNAEVALTQGLGTLRDHFEADRFLTKDAKTGNWVDDTSRTDSKNVTRYVYTTQLGWIDMHHFFYFAASTVAVGAESSRDLAKKSEWGQGAIGRDASAYSYEDLPSDEAGIKFIEKYGEQLLAGNLSIVEAMNRFLKSAGAVDPSKAPNFDFIPPVVRDSDLPMKNKTLQPLVGDALRNAHKERFDKASANRKKEIIEARSVH